MRFLSTLFYMLLSILGLSVISLGGLITVQYFRGKITGTDLHSIMRVIAEPTASSFPATSMIATAPTRLMKNAPMPN